LRRGEEALDPIRAHHRRDLARLADLIELRGQVVPAQRHPNRNFTPATTPLRLQTVSPLPARSNLEAADVVGAGRRRRAIEKGGKTLAAGMP
jgi:hypothetical protein